MSHMQCQLIFNGKEKKKKKIECCLIQILLDALRVKKGNERYHSYFWYSDIHDEQTVLIQVFTVCLSLGLTLNRLLDCQMSALMAQLDAPSDWRPGGRGFNPHLGRQHSFVAIDHEIFSTVILSLPLIQEGQLSVSGERMCTILVNRLED